MNSKQSSRKTQAQRRQETRQKVLDSACRIFGEKGFDATSLEDIAVDVGVTVSPIYHYFGNKLNLFAEANLEMERRLVATMDGIIAENALDVALTKLWETFVGLCRSPGFVQIVLLDAPHILGRERWRESIVAKRVQDLLHSAESGLFSGMAIGALFSDKDKDLIMRMLIAALAEMALMKGQDPEYDGSNVITILIGFLLQHAKV